MKKYILITTIIFMLISIRYNSIHSTKFKYNISFNNKAENTVMYIYDGIKYVSLNDTLKLMNSIYKNNKLDLVHYPEGYKLVNDNDLIDFNINENSIVGHIDINYGLYLNQQILFDNIIRDDIEYNYKEFNIDLSKFGIELFVKHGELYLPYELLSLLIFGRSVYIKDNLNGTLIVDQGYLHKNFKVKKDLSDLTIEQKKYIYNLLNLYLDYIFPYKNDNLVYIKDYINNNLEYMSNDEYYDSIAKLLALNDDLHTNPYYFSETKAYTPTFIHKLKDYDFSRNYDIVFKTMDDNVYVKIPHFNSLNLKDILYTKLNTDYKNYKNIILDLRDNSGGYFIEYRNLLKIFKDDIYEYYIYDYNSSEVNKYKIINNEDHLDYNNLVVLINKNTHSSASIFALGVKNNDIGIIIGEESIGYHTDNRYIYLCDNSIIRMSTGGILINKDGSDIYGVKPDIEVTDRNSNTDHILDTAINYLKDN